MVEHVLLGDLVTVQRGQSYKSEYIGKPGPYLLGLGTIQRNGGFRADNLRTYGGPTSKFIRLQEGDLFASLKDVTHAADLLGAVARVPHGVTDARLTQDTVRVDVVSDRIDVDYLYWALRSPQYRTYCRLRGTGTTNLDLSREDFYSFPIMLPKRSVQRTIADVLSALDDKIAANTKLTIAADELVRTEYRELSSSVAESVTLGSLAKNVRDLAEPDGSDSLYVGLEHVPRHLMWLTGWGSMADVSSTKARFVEQDVLFGKLRPYFHKVVAAPSSGVCSTDILVLRAVDMELAGFVLAAAASDAVVGAVTASSEGTRMPRASWRDLAACEVPWPGDVVARAFSVRVASLRDYVQARLRENEGLGAIRDALLPALMSGRLTIRDAEVVVESTSDGRAVEPTVGASGTLW